MLHTMHKDLGHNFIDYVAKAYRPTMIYGFKSKLFWDEGNQSPIEVFRNFLSSKIFLNSNFIDFPTTIQNL